METYSKYYDYFVLRNPHDDDLRDNTFDKKFDTNNWRTFVPDLFVEDWKNFSWQERVLIAAYAQTVVDAIYGG